MVPRERRRRPPSMSLRLRLVAALAALLTVGLAVFGVATYGVQSRAEYRRLDDGLRATVPNVGHSLTAAFGLSDAGRHATKATGSTGKGASGPAADGTSDGPNGSFDPGREAELGTYAELRDASGRIVQTIPLLSGAAPRRGSARPCWSTSRSTPARPRGRGNGGCCSPPSPSTSAIGYSSPSRPTRSRSRCAVCCSSRPLPVSRCSRCSPRAPG